MIEYPRFTLYRVHNEQSGTCAKCRGDIDVRLIELTQLVGGKVYCMACLLKDDDMYESDVGQEFPDLAPMYGFDLSYVLHAKEQDTDFESEEAALEDSWFHRAMLGDEGRIPYDDGQDTDFDLLASLDEAQQTEDDSGEQNGNLCFEYKT